MTSKPVDNSPTTPSIQYAKILCTTEVYFLVISLQITNKIVFYLTLAQWMVCVCLGSVNNKVKLKKSTLFQTLHNRRRGWLRARDGMACVDWLWGAYWWLGDEYSGAKRSSLSSDRNHSYCGLATHAVRCPAGTISTHRPTPTNTFVVIWTIWVALII
jgi:hypothetical protein